MSGQSIKRRANRVLQRHGEPMVLKRAGQADIPLKGKRIPGTVDEVGGNGAVQQEFRVKITVVELDASAWSVKEPKRTDRITIGGRDRTVLDAKPLGDSGVVALYELLVSG